jgi:hypothetical protein
VTEMEGASAQPEALLAELYTCWVFDQRSVHCAREASQAR